MKNSIRRFIGSLFKSLAVIIVLLAISVFRPTARFAQRPLGVDVSNHQGLFNWTNVLNAGVTFAWAKATEGTTFTDADFVANETNGKALGIYIGAYHFAHPETNAPASEVAHFWNIASPYILADGKTLMPMLDMEAFTAVTGASNYSDWVNQWCDDAVADAAGQGVRIVPAIYVSACNAGNFNSTIAQWGADISNT